MNEREMNEREMNEREMNEISSEIITVDKKEPKKRNFNLDLIRAVAVFSVLSVHFFLNNGFYATIENNKRMYAMTVARTGFMVCVPLFLLLTGYLMNKKVLSKKYYRGGIKILAIYVMSSIACLLFNDFYLAQDLKLKDYFFSILNFTGAKYAWYMNLYFGLFLLIPFINLIYNNLKNKKEKKALIITLLILTTLPSALNIYNFYLAGWFLTPGMSNSYQFLVPDWWINIFPLTYYFIGAYLSEYEIKLKKWKNLLIFVICVVAFGSFNYYRSYGLCFLWDAYSHWNGFENVIISVLIFIFMLHMNLEKIPLILKKLITKISELALGIYLVSYIFDTVIYERLNNAVPIMEHRMEYYVIVVPLVFTCSLLLSYIIDILYKGITRGANFVYTNISRKR